MTGVNYFIGKTQAWLEAELAKVQEDLAAGKTLVSWGAGESNAVNVRQMSLQTRFDHLYRALHELDPDNYPATNFRVRRTTPRYVL
jgi:hypothetical protein